MEDTGWLWFVIDVILVAGLGIGIAYAGPGTEAMRDAATHRAYEQNPANRP